MKTGFTLIELSIVLVIIGLIIGGVLVGRDLIDAATVRAQISQIEKYQTAVNTFRGKYGYLPGDIPDPVASNYGFVTRGTYPAEGDNNGLIEGNWPGNNTVGQGFCAGAGETVVFWRDLSDAKLINESFNLAGNDGSTSPPFLGDTRSVMSQWFPPAKIGQGNYVYVWSGGLTGAGSNAISNGKNYFGVNAISYISNCLQYSTTAITVAQAYNIDKKIDDGLPQSGRVQATYLHMLVALYAAGGNAPSTQPALLGDYHSIPPGYYGPVISAAEIGDGTAAGPLSCFDGSAGLPEQYSMGQSNGSGMNCALSFQFQ